jgi:predicted ATPase
VTAPVIRTPDQRLRVFVSSTLRELEKERLAARGAIERLRLAPVMFELGARPHPPRELYRAYLAQSDVFVGIYGERYGWTAPGEEISGLEDEYRLAPSALPKLIYLMEPAEREERLEELIGRIRADDTASYKSFSTPEELGELIQSDLAILLAERFDAGRANPAEPAQPAPSSSRLPATFTPLIGRDRETAEVLALLAQPGTRLVTLLGPGGIGKSRLSLAVAAAASQAFADGTVFVPLENVLEAGLLLPTIGYALGVRDTGEVPLTERLAIALEGRRMLLVLDNFEQIVDAAPILVELYTIAPDAALLVTSRVLLRVRGERVYEVPPLASYDQASPDSIARARTSPAVELFVERARAVKPDFAVTDANAAAVVGICRTLEGMPLAIELAAARMRMLTPSAILARLDRQLPLLVESSRDLPERQRTLRSTIEWSTGLLTASERRLLHDLSVFSLGFTLDSVEALGARRGWDFPAFDTLANLVDSSLVEQEDVEGESVFSMLATVREYGIERLREAGDEIAARTAHAEVYAALARRMEPGLSTDRQTDAVARLNLERGNLRGAVRHLVAIGDTEAATDVAWRLYIYWWVGGYLMEVAAWMEELMARSGAEASPHATAVAQFYVCWRDMWDSPTHAVPQILVRTADLFTSVKDELGAAMSLATAGIAELNTPDPDLAAASRWLIEASERFRGTGAGWGEALGLIALGRLAVLRGDIAGGTELFRRSVAASANSGDQFASTIATHHLARMLLFGGQIDEPERMFRSAIEGSMRLRHEEGMAYGLEGLCAIAALHGDVERAGVLAGAAGAMRRRVATFDSPGFVYHTRYVDALVADAHDPAQAAAIAERLRAAEERGAEYGAYEAAEYALAGAPGTQDLG